MIKRVLSLALCLMLAASMMPGMPLKASAANAEYLYITETPGAESLTVSEDAEGTGWRWQKDGAVLTLSGYDGGPIEVPSGDVRIELKGENRITIENDPPGSSSSIGIDAAGGKLTIAASEEDPTASLWVGNTDLSRDDCYYIAVSGYSGIYLESGSLSVEMVNTSGGHYYYTALSSGNGSTYMQGSAALAVSVDAGAEGDGRGFSRGVHYASSGDLTVSVSGSKNSAAADSFFSEEGGQGSVLLSCPGGYALSSGILNLHEDLEELSFRGLVRCGSTWRDYYISNTYTYNIPEGLQFQTMEGEALLCGFVYRQLDPHTYGYFLTDAEGGLVSSCRLKNTGAAVPLTFMDSETLDLTDLKTETPASTTCFHSLVNGGVRPYTFSIRDDTVLPEGFKITQYDRINDTWGGSFYAYITGTPVKPCPAGSFVLVVTDSSEPAQTAEITIGYSEIAEKEKWMTVGGETFDSRFDEPSEGHPAWSWDAASETLRLSGYGGGPIWREAGDVRIALTGENRVNVPDGEYDVDQKIGVRVQDGSLSITGEAEGAELWVGNKAIGLKHANYVAVEAKGNIVIEDADLNIELADDPEAEGQGYYRYGISSNGGSTYLRGTSGLAIVIDSPDSEVRGINRGLHFVSSGSVGIRCGGTSRSCALDSIQTEAGGTGDVLLSAPGCYAVGTGVLVLHEDLGVLTLEGLVKNGFQMRDSYMENDLYIPSNHAFVTPEGDPLACGIAYYKGDGLEGNFLLDAEDLPVASCRFVPKGEPQPLSFLHFASFDIPELKVGVSEGWYPVYLHGAAMGGTRPYTFALKDGEELPEGLQLRAYDGMASGLKAQRTYLYGTPANTYEAGEFVLVVTDSSEPAQTAEITIRYGACTADSPVTGVEISQTSAEMTIGDTLELSARVLPENATVQAVSFSVDDWSVAKIEQIADGICRLTALKEGTAIVTATSREGKKTAVCGITVSKKIIEAVPLTIALPRAGQQPSFEPGLPDGAGFAAEVAWFDAEEQVLLSPYSIFAPGTQYKAVLTLTANEDSSFKASWDGLQYMPAEDLAATVNGEEPLSIEPLAGDARGGLVITCLFESISEGPYVKAKKDKKEKKISCKAQAPEGSVLMCAQYDEAGRFLGLVTVPITGDSEEFAIDDPDRTYVLFMVDGSLVPLVPATAAD